MSTSELNKLKNAQYHLDELEKMISGNKWYSQGVLDLSDQISLLQDDVDDLIDNLDLLITAGRLTDQNRKIIKNYLNITKLLYWCAMFLGVITQ